MYIIANGCVLAKSKIGNYGSSEVLLNNDLQEIWKEGGGC